MKRHKALRILSDEHHQGLVWSRRLRDIKDSVSQDQLKIITDEFITVWHDEIDPHFRKEEEILLPLFARTGQGTADPIMEMLKQHILLRREVFGIMSDPHPNLLNNLGALLNDHIRHEEREVFPMIEEKAEEELLREIGEKLNE